MRARNIKPGLFKNEVLGAASPLYTIVFEGLWCMADREGRLEDRPMRIHVEVNPFRALSGTVSALSWLADHGFIDRYSVDGGKFIQINCFRRHQNPHQREADSIIPARAQPRTGQGTAKAVPSPADSLFSDSPSLIPDSPSPHPAVPALGGSNGKGAHLELHESLPTATWEEWLDHRRKRSWPVNERTLRRQLKILRDYDTETQAEIIDTAIQAGWQGLFRPRGGGPSKPPKSKPMTAEEAEAMEAKRAAS